MGFSKIVKSSVYNEQVSPFGLLMNFLKNKCILLSFSSGQQYWQFLAVWYIDFAFPLWYCDLIFIVTLFILLNNVVLFHVLNDHRIFFNICKKKWNSASEVALIPVYKEFGINVGIKGAYIKPCVKGQTGFSWSVNFAKAS